MASKTWFWTKRVGDDRERHLTEFAQRHGGFVVTQRKDPGLFANSFPVATGRHAGREMVIEYGGNGYNTRYQASASHTIFIVPVIAGLTEGLRVFPSMTGGFVAKGGRRGEAEAWLNTGDRRVQLTTRLDDVGHTALSEVLGLTVHAAGMALSDEAMVAALDDVAALATALE